MKKHAKNPLYVSQKVADIAVDIMMARLGGFFKQYGSNPPVQDGAQWDIASPELTDAIRHDYPGRMLKFHLIYDNREPCYSGFFGRSSTVPRIIVYVNSDAADMATDRKEWEKARFHLRSTISHEMAHWEDDQIKPINGIRDHKDEADYNNDPMEVKAFGREIYDAAYQLTLKQKYTRQQVAQMCIKNSQRFYSSLTDKNKKWYTSLIYQGIVDAEEELSQRRESVMARVIGRITRQAYGPMKLDEELLNSLSYRLYQIINILLRKQGVDGEFQPWDGVLNVTEFVEHGQELMNELGLSEPVKFLLGYNGENEYDIVGYMASQPGVSVVLQIPANFNEYTAGDSAVWTSEIKNFLAHELTHIKDFNLQGRLQSADKDNYHNEDGTVDSVKYFTDKEEIVGFSKNIYDFALNMARAGYELPDVVSETKERFYKLFNTVEFMENQRYYKRYLSIIGRAWQDYLEEEKRRKEQ